MKTNPVSYFYHQVAFKNAFPIGSNLKMIITNDGSVFAGSVSSENLVVSGTSVVGDAGLARNGDISIIANRDGILTGALAVTFTGTNGTLFAKGGIPTNKQWIHGALTIDNINKEIKLYVDTTLVDTVKFTGDVTPFASIRDVILGRNVDVTKDEFAFTGRIDDFRIYKTVLNEQDIKDIVSFGNQKLNFDEKIYVPKRDTSRGRALSLKIESEDFMQVRSIAIEYFNKRLK